MGFYPSKPRMLSSAGTILSLLLFFSIDAFPYARFYNRNGMDCTLAREEFWEDMDADHLRFEGSRLIYSMYFVRDYYVTLRTLRAAGFDVKAERETSWIFSDCEVSIPLSQVDRVVHERKIGTWVYYMEGDVPSIKKIE